MEGSMINLIVVSTAMYLKASWVDLEVQVLVTEKSLHVFGV